MVTLMVDKNLGFIFQPSKGGRMDYAVTVTLEGGAVLTLIFLIQATMIMIGKTSVFRQKRRRVVKIIYHKRDLCYYICCE